MKKEGKWKPKYPLLHDPFVRKWVKMVVRGGVRYELRRATVEDIAEAFEIDRSTAKRCYDSGESPFFLPGGDSARPEESIISRARTREDEGDAP